MNKIKKFLVASAIAASAMVGVSHSAEAQVWGCRTVDYGSYAGARCEANDGQDPDRVRVQIICSNDPYRRWQSGPWVPAGPYYYTSWKYCAHGAPMLNWRYQIGA